MKYKQIIDKFRKLFTLSANLKNDLKKQVKLNDNSKIPSVNTYIKTLYEGNWRVAEPIFPESEWFTETFNSVEGITSWGIDEAFGYGGVQGYYDIHDFEERWLIELIATKGHISQTGIIDYGFRVAQGGIDFEKKHYRCSSRPWRGWEDELFLGKCPIDQEGELITDPDYEHIEGVIENPLKYFNSHYNHMETNYFLGTGTIKPKAELTARLTSTSLNTACQVKMKLKIGHLYFIASGSYGSDVIYENPFCGCIAPRTACIDTQVELDSLKPTAVLGGEINIKVGILVPGEGTKYITYYYPSYSQSAPSAPANSITLTSLDGFDRVLFDDYKTIYGTVGEEVGLDDDGVDKEETTWHSYNVNKIIIQANAHGEGVVAWCATATGLKVGGVTSPATCDLDFSIDNIQLYGTDETLIKFPYTLESPALVLSDTMLPFMHITALTKINTEDSKNTDNEIDINDFLPISPYYEPYQQTLFQKVESTKAEGVNKYILSLSNALMIDLEYPWDNLQYPQVKLRIDYIPDLIDLEQKEFKIDYKGKDFKSYRLRGIRG